MGAQAALADSTVEGLYSNAVIAEPDGPGPRVCLAPGFEVHLLALREEAHFQRWGLIDSTQTEDDPTDSPAKHPTEVRGRRERGVEQGVCARGRLRRVPHGRHLRAPPGHGAGPRGRPQGGGGARLQLPLALRHGPGRGGPAGARQGPCLPPRHRARGQERQDRRPHGAGWGVDSGLDVRWGVGVVRQHLIHLHARARTQKLFGENSVHCIIYWIDDRGAWAVLKDTSGPLHDGRLGKGKRNLWNFCWLAGLRGWVWLAALTD